MKPLYDRLIVKLVDEKDKTEGGIFIPDELKEKPNMGKVIAVGCGKMLASGKIVSMQVKLDNIVYFNKYSGVPFKEGHLILREEDVLGII